MRKKLNNFEKEKWFEWNCTRVTEGNWAQENGHCKFLGGRLVGGKMMTAREAKINKMEAEKICLWQIW